ncbi:hypothetical protein N657DRAFT_649451 [Parathielavia appendiculata]|uniref:Uncharacterized protein n=1 Tax=Parathielavia appendiculata TaxID=2587402 RepID=A0AAN6TSW5_9PEZI|nr:hypothetical protein N657DRAFT_649451 [Parathielavia appendiculata]
MVSFPKTLMWRALERALGSGLVLWSSLDVIRTKWTRSPILGRVWDIDMDRIKKHK